MLSTETKGKLLKPLNGGLHLRLTNNNDDPIGMCVEDGFHHVPAIAVSAHRATPSSSHWTNTTRSGWSNVGQNRLSGRDDHVWHDGFLSAPRCDALAQVTGRSLFSQSSSSAGFLSGTAMALPSLRTQFESPVTEPSVRRHTAFDSTSFNVVNPISNQPFILLRDEIEE